MRGWVSRIEGPALVRADNVKSFVEDLSQYNPGLRMIAVMGRLAILDEESEANLAKFDGKEPDVVEIHVDTESLETAVAQFTMAHLQEALQRCGGNKMKAAKLLGMSYLKLYRMLERVGVKTG